MAKQEMKRHESLWNSTESLPQSEKLKRDIKTDVLVIGGGLCGLLTAYSLRKNGVDCVLVEKGRIMGGISGNTTAKITAQHGLIYHKLIKSIGEEKAKLYLKANLEAIGKYEELSEKFSCDFERKDNYVYSTESREKLENEMKALRILGCKAEFERSLPIPVDSFGAVKFTSQAQFHPIKFAKGIMGELEIFENTFVRAVAGTKVRTDENEITANKIVVATHFPFINNHGAYFMKMYQHRSHVIALSDAAQYEGMYVDDRKDGMSFRNHGELLLVGGGDHKTGRKGGNWAELRSFRNVYYPESREEFFWAAQDCMTIDGVPYIGQYSKNTPNMYVATGFNKWGMTGAMVAAQILTDMITGKETPYRELFLPGRSMLKPQLFLNGFETAVNFLTPTKKRCPHLGCALKWNSAEHSWDCPCHGSRFSEKGELLDNPSNGDLF